MTDADLNEVAGFLHRGLTMQSVDRVQEVEIGYHARTELQQRDYAIEAALGCIDVAKAHGIWHIIATIHPDNLPSQKVAGNLCLSLEKANGRRRRPPAIDLQPHAVVRSGTGTAAGCREAAAQARASRIGTAAAAAQACGKQDIG